MTSKITLCVLQESFSVCQLASHDPIPLWVNDLHSPFLSITRTPDELSIVCEKKKVPSNVLCVTDWSAFKVEGPLDFQLVGILSSLLEPLATASISVFTISTYDTDYILVKTADLQKAILTLQKKFIVKQ